MEISTGDRNSTDCYIVRQWTYGSCVTAPSKFQLEDVFRCWFAHFEVFILIGKPTNSQHVKNAYQTTSTDFQNKSPNEWGEKIIFHLLLMHLSLALEVIMYFLATFEYWPFFSKLFFWRFDDFAVQFYQCPPSKPGKKEALNISKETLI